MEMGWIYNSDREKPTSPLLYFQAVNQRLLLLAGEATHLLAANRLRSEWLQVAASLLAGLLRTGSMQRKVKSTEALEVRESNEKSTGGGVGEGGRGGVGSWSCLQAIALCRIVCDQCQSGKSQPGMKLGKLCLSAL